MSSIPKWKPRTAGEIKILHSQTPENIRREVDDLAEIVFNLSDGLVKHYDDIHMDTYGECDITYFLRRINKLLNSRANWMGR